MNQLAKALGVGAVLAIVGIGLFIGIYIALGDMPDATRLFTALFIPPLVMGILLGAYYLVTQNQNSDNA